MAWAVKAIQILSSSKTGRKIIGVLVILALIVSLMPVMMAIAPIAVVSTPFLWLISGNEQERINNEYVSIMTQYKGKMNDKIREKKQSENGTGVSITYPSLSLMVAYDNAIHKERYNSGNPSNASIEIDAAVLSDFLDRTIVYSNQGGIITSTLKDIDTIVNENFADDPQGKGLFKSYYMTLSNTELDNKVPDVPFIDIVGLSGGIELPYYSQFDANWQTHRYGTSTIGSSGCGIASLSMVISGLLDREVLPPELADWGGDSYYVQGAGSSWSLFPGAATKYGLTIKNLTRADPSSIQDELMYNHPVIVSMSAGHFTSGGHFIVLRGFDEDGNVIVSDPASLERSNTTWDFRLILSESSTLSAYCFWSFALPE